ncbi:MAG: tetratricopeptide repeat protein [Gammaproteobacteria bacterium]|nr:tetratricopeptide repeat protein [Gammaproteobacteria bacterium]
MDLSHVQWKRLRCFIQQSLLFSATILLAACASFPPQQMEQAPSVGTAHTEVDVSKSTQPGLPLTAELVYYILMAEIAGQRGELGLAVDLYEKAADAIDSPALAGRSTQIANFTRDQKRINRALKRWIAVDPTDADVYIMQAPFLMLQGDYDAVVAAINTALELAPDKASEYLTRLSDNLNELATPEQALSVIKQIKAYKANDPEALFTYARLSAFYNNYDIALPAIESVLNQQENREDALILKAEILQRLKKGKAAMSILKRVATSNDASEKVRFAYAKLLGENHKTPQARLIFEQLHNEQPENEEVIFALGLLALEEKDGHQAKQYFSQLVTLGDRGKQASYFLGLAEELNHDIDAALIWFASVPADSQRFQAAQSRYVHLLADNGQLKEARLHIKLLRKEHPDRSVHYYLFEASFLRERGHEQAAFDIYSEALKHHPDHIELLYGRAMVSEPLNRLSVLEQDLLAILAQQPNNPQALNALGYTLTDRTNRHEEALALILKAIEIKPNDPFYLDSLGWVYYRMGKLNEAVRYLKQAVEIQDDPEFLAHLGEALWQLGQHSEAKKVWQRGLKQDPDNKLLNQTLRLFRR